MKQKRIRASAAVAFLAAFAFGSATAGTIQSGTVIAQTTSSCCGLVAELLLDQSGLSSGYVSGITDFSTYLSSNPTSTGSSNVPNFPAGYFSTAGAVVDIDLGTTITVTRLAMWNDHDYQGVNRFSLLIDDASDFVGAVSLGAFNALYGNNDNVQLDYSTGAPHQVFDLNDVSGRYVRIVFESAHQDNFINLNEIAFENGGNNNPVPEPGTLALLGLGVLGLLAARRDRRA